MECRVKRMTVSLLESAEYTGVCGRRCGSSPYLVHGFSQNWWLLTSDTMGMAFVFLLFSRLFMGALHWVSKWVDVQARVVWYGMEWAIWDGVAELSLRHRLRNGSS
jgi:hypothetical protein